MIKKLGKRIRALRLAQEFSQEEFCGDESELSVRQLSRIENGTCNPTFTKITYIADRLGVSLAELTEERFELPLRYKELKTFLLKNQTFGDPKRLAEKEAFLTEIYDEFFHDLPEEEQLVIEILDSRLAIITEAQAFSAEKILGDYLNQVKAKSTYRINDLVLLDLYFLCLSFDETSPLSSSEEMIYHRLVNNLLLHQASLPLEELFMLNKVLIGIADDCLKRGFLHHLPQLMATISDIMTKTQDFAHLPILKLLNWKQELATTKKLEQAEIHFQDACLFANLTGDPYLLDRLHQEWERDALLFER